MLTHRAHTPLPSWGRGRWGTAALKRLLLAAVAFPAVRGLAGLLCASASGAAAPLQVHPLVCARSGLSLPLCAAGKPAQQCILNDSSCKLYRPGAPHQWQALVKLSRVSAGTTHAHMKGGCTTMRTPTCRGLLTCCTALLLDALLRPACPSCLSCCGLRDGNCTLACQGDSMCT